MRIGFYSNFEIDENFLRNQIGEDFFARHEVLINPCGLIDVAITFNFASKLRAYVHRGPEYFMVMEPQIPGPWHTFAWRRSTSSKKVFSPLHEKWSALPWQLNFSVDQLRLLGPTHKERDISAIVSTASALPGHKSRLSYVQALQENGVIFDLFGRGRDIELEDKGAGLLPYMYSLAIENSNQKSYFTEKLFDPILCWSVPVYIGAPNVHEYFPDGSYISLPPDNPERGAEILKSLSYDDYLSRIPALKRARDLVLEKYSMGAVVRELVACHKGQAVNFSTTLGFNLITHGTRNLIAKNWSGRSQ